MIRTGTIWLKLYEVFFLCKVQSFFLFFREGTKRMWRSWWTCSRHWGRREHWVLLDTSPIEMFAFLPQNGTKLGVLHLLPLPGSVTITEGSPSVLQLFSSQQDLAQNRVTDMFITGHVGRDLQPWYHSPAAIWYGEVSL